jgi:penicillin-binding protein 1C
MQHSNWFVLPTAMEWYYKQNHHDYKPLPPFKEGCGENSNGKQMEIIYPQMDAKIYVPYELSGEKGKTVFTAAHRNSNAKIFWHIDENYFTTTSYFHQVALSPAPGKHILTLVDESGESITRAFEILEKEKSGH